MKTNAEFLAYVAEFGFNATRHKLLSLKATGELADNLADLLLAKLAVMESGAIVVSSPIRL